MEEKLTNQQIAELCSYLRVIDLFQKNPHILEQNPPIKQDYDDILALVNDVMNTISEKQRDEVLEIHRIQSIQIANEITKNNKK